MFLTISVIVWLKLISISSICLWQKGTDIFTLITDFFTASATVAEYCLCLLKKTLILCPFVLRKHPHSSLSLPKISPSIYAFIKFIFWFGVRTLNVVYHSKLHFFPTFARCAELEFLLFCLLRSTIKKNNTTHVMWVTSMKLLPYYYYYDSFITKWFYYNNL